MDHSHVRLMTDDDIPEVLSFLALDPVASVLATSRVLVAAARGFAVAGGHVWGFPRHGPLTALCWIGANIVPVCRPGLPDQARRGALVELAQVAVQYGSTATAVVGERNAALELWECIAPHRSRPRDIRPRQLSMAISGPPLVSPDMRVRIATAQDFEVFFPASVAMFTEEVGYSPVAYSSTMYANRVRSFIDARQAFIWRDHSGEVVFKAELGAVAPGMGQVQGVWVNPQYRGSGLAAGAMARVVTLTQASGLGTVSLYVNDFNARAVATYRRVGFKLHGMFATVLF